MGLLTNPVESVIVSKYNHHQLQQDHASGSILQAINQETQDYLSLLRAIYEYHRPACEIVPISPRNHHVYLI